MSLVYSHSHQHRLGYRWIYWRCVFFFAFWTFIKTEVSDWETDIVDAWTRPCARFDVNQIWNHLFYVISRNKLRREKRFSQSWRNLHTNNNNRPIALVPRKNVNMWKLSDRIEYRSKFDTNTKLPGACHFTLLHIFFGVWEIKEVTHEVENLHFLQMQLFNGRRFIS